MVVFPAIRRLRKVDLQFEATLGYIVKNRPKKERERGRGGE